MKALLYGVRPESVPEPETDNHLVRNLAHTPMQLVDMDEPRFLLPDWVVTEAAPHRYLRLGLQAGVHGLGRGALARQSR